MQSKRVMGIEPTLSAWKAEVLPLNYTRTVFPQLIFEKMEGGGFEPPKAEPSDLQSDPFGHSGTPPKNKRSIVLKHDRFVNLILKNTSLT